MRFPLCISLLTIIKIALGYNGVFWHICDLHLNISHASPNAGYYGNYAMDSTFSLIKSAFQQMVKIHPNPDFIIVNGDNVHHYDVSDEAFQKTLNNVSKTLYSQFSNFTILPTLGNHDVNPANILDVNSKWCKNYYAFWKDFFKDANKSDQESFQKGCYYSKSLNSSNGTILAIVLNTLLWYRSNTNMSFLTDPLDQFSWLENELQHAREANTKVFIIAHVPPGASEFKPKEFKHLHDKFNERFLRILQSNSDIIDAGFFAHQHTDAFKIVYDSKGTPVVPLFLVPSVTPYHLRELGSVNPSIRLYIWKNDSSKSIYKQYHTSLYVPPNNDQLNWTLEYESSSLLAGLSAKNYDNLLSDLNSGNSKYFDKFFSYHLSGRSHDIGSCSPNSECRCRILCGLRYIDYADLDSCLDKCYPRIVIYYRWFWIIFVVVVGLIIFITLFYIIYRKRCGRRNLPNENYEILS